MATLDETQAEANLKDAQWALDKPERKLKNMKDANVEDSDAINKAHIDYQHCLTNFNQLKNTLENRRRVLATRKQSHLEAQTLVNTTRQELQEAKNSL
ncbi:unnamed protein product [Rotaria sordida]|nr:unnamed protein product [Rotaria sordida]CAF0895348.1 unnamed protein product [Rotaria sordida]